MKLTATVRLLTTPEQAAALRDSLIVANECANWISERAFHAQKFREFPLYYDSYKLARQQFPALAGEMVCAVIRKVAKAYATDRKVQRHFRPLGGVGLKGDCLKWKAAGVSIWSIAGRLKLGYVAGDHQVELLKTQKGQSELHYGNGDFYLAAPCDVPEPQPRANDVLGVDLGIVNIATDSDAAIYSGKGLCGIRIRNGKLRSRLQAKRSRSAKRRLRKLSGREKRFAKDVNHCISKQLIQTAQRTKRAIALEDLKGIGARVRARRQQRAMLRSWAFYQLRTFIAYKAALAGVPVLFVRPDYTSRICPQCGYNAKANRKTQALFLCQACGLSGPADFIAATNIRGRALANAPYVSTCAAVSH